ncbi:hypothetical protein M3Y99_01529600 [Aphelenchoides fujianensis]|nr:hypothetical protein M3Y99_01529600 [Aphelenchoides fujianensis]
MRKAAVLVPPRRSPLRLLVWAALWLFGVVGLLLFALGLRASGGRPASTAFQRALPLTADDGRPAFVWPPECILGAEHLPELLDAPQLFANKFLPAFDFGAAVCWLAELHRRQHADRGVHRLRPAFYLERPQVRFNRERQRWGDRFNVSLFDCFPWSDGYSVQ